MKKKLKGLLKRLMEGFKNIRIKKGLPYLVQESNIFLTFRFI